MRTGRATRIDFSHALHAEWTKLRTTPAAAWLALAAIILTAGLSAASAAAAEYRTGGQQDLARTGLTGIDLGQAMIAILAVLIALLSLGIATAVRDSAVAVGIVLALLYLFPIIAAAVGNPTWRRHLTQIGPMDAGLAIQHTRDVSDLPIGPWAGLGVLAAWAGAALLAATAALRLRDA